MKVVRHALADGDPQIYGTVDIMARLIREDVSHPTIRRIADRLAKGTVGDWDYAERAHRYVVDEIEYQNDRWDGQKKEVVAAARHTLAGNRKKGDCDCMVVALGVLLSIKGIPIKIKTVAWQPKQKDVFTHVYLVFFSKEADAWIPLDPTAGYKGYGWEVQPIYRKKYYDV